MSDEQEQAGVPEPKPGENISAEQHAKYHWGAPISEVRQTEVRVLAGQALLAARLRALDELLAAILPRAPTLEEVAEARLRLLGAEEGAASAGRPEHDDRGGQRHAAAGNGRP